MRYFVLLFLLLLPGVAIAVIMRGESMVVTRAEIEKCWKCPPGDISEWTKCFNTGVGCGASPRSAEETASVHSAKDGLCRNDGYYVENGLCSPKTFSIILHTKIPGISKSMRCVFDDKMLRNGINGDDFNDGCSMPFIARPEEFGLSQFSWCGWFDMGDSQNSAQQRIVNFFYDPDGRMIITEKENTFNVKSRCATRDGQRIDFY